MSSNQVVRHISELWQEEIITLTVEEHQAIRVNRCSGKDFIIVSAEDWERDQETL